MKLDRVLDARGGGVRQISRLLMSDFLEKEEKHLALDFRARPERWRGKLPPIVYSFLHATLVDEVGFEEIERVCEAPSRSAKAMLSLGLHCMRDALPQPPEPGDEIATLREHIIYLRGEDPGDLLPFVELGMSPLVARLMAILRNAKGRPLSRGQLMVLLYDRRPEADQPSEKIIDVLLSKARPKLPDHMRIETVYSLGYRLIEDVPGA